MNNIASATLVVVDMQPEFATPNHLIPAVESKIRYWIEHNWPIVIVEFGDYTHTYPKIMELLNGYPFFTKVTKRKVDGSFDVLDACRRAGFANDHFVAIGQYYVDCLSGTAAGIAKILPSSTVDIPLEACDLEPGEPLPRLKKKMPKNVHVLDAQLDIADGATEVDTENPTASERRW